MTARHASVIDLIRGFSTLATLIITNIDIITATIIK
jgi:hypothetical protein